jgi:hypothetical protein
LLYLLVQERLVDYVHGILGVVNKAVLILSEELAAAYAVD